MAAPHRLAAVRAASAFQVVAGHVRAHLGDVGLRQLRIRLAGRLYPPGAAVAVTHRRGRHRADLIDVVGYAPVRACAVALTGFAARPAPHALWLGLTLKERRGLALARPPRRLHTTLQHLDLALQPGDVALQPADTSRVVSYLRGEQVTLSGHPRQLRAQRRVVGLQHDTVVQQSHDGVADHLHPRSLASHCR